MTPIRPTAAALAALLALTGQSYAQETATEETAAEATETAEPGAPAADITAETVVARVGDVTFTMGHVLAMRAQLPDRVAQLPDDVLLQGIVDQLIDQYLLSQSVNRETLPKAIELQYQNESRGALAAAALQMVLSSAVTEEALQDAYDAQYANAEPATEYNASHILLETEEDALAVVETLDGGADFAETAVEQSTGPSGPRGGELGWFGEGVMIEEFFNAVTELEEGGVSAPIQTQFGWHVIKLNETRPVEPPTLAEVAPTLAQELQQAAVEARVAELREAADTEVMLEGIDPAQLRNNTLLED